LSHKDEETYILLFEQLRKALMNEFGDVGPSKMVMFDFEIAAHKALLKVFPEWSLSSCYFHFIKSITGQAKKKGLSAAMKMDDFKYWMDEILGRFF